MTTRRTLLRLMSATALCAPAAGLLGGTMARAADEVVRIGYVVSRTGLNAAGATITTIPNYELWVHDVNARGGLKLPDGSQRRIEVIEYDDRSVTEEVVKGITRLATSDKVDFILPPWGAAFNLAVAPLMSRFGYPQLTTTATVDKAAEFAERWPTSFWMLGASGSYQGALAEMLRTEREAGRLGNKVAILSIADGGGIEQVVEARKLLPAAGFEIVIDKTYPIGTQDFASLLGEAQASGADSFLAFSYPPDSIALVRQARLSGYNPPVFFVGVGGAFPNFPELNEGHVEGVSSMGGVTAGSPEFKAYSERLQAVMGKKADYWASPIIYATLEMLVQAIERRGLDRPAIAEELSTGSFETILGTIQLENNMPKDMWRIGQWQGDTFVGVAPIGKDGAVPLILPKPAW
jgi:branched-chain amino acid transport system substrate-binding protein